MRRLAIMLAAAAIAAGCTDTTRARVSALGESARITCWSGGTLVYDGRSTGKVERAESGADGYQFKDAKTGSYKEVSGDCNVTYGEQQ